MFGRYAASSSARNSTLQAIHDADLTGDGDASAVNPSAQVPFSSRRRWSALELGSDRLVLGAPEALLGHRREPPRAGGATRRQPAGACSRWRPPPGRCRRAAPDAPLPDGLAPLGIVVLAERLRDSADRTVAFFTSEGVALKVLSGDNPATVGAIARDAGIPAQSDALDGGALPDTDAALLEAVRAAPAIGRISAEDKARVVRVLSDAGEYVGMLGDGINDVPALKRARLAIAQGTGTQMARSVSDLVLVSGEFSEVPRIVHEGRQILRNIQRVARLFIAKATFTAFLLITVALTTGVFPLLPRQFTLTSSLTIGIPAFFLALAPSSGPWRTEGFLRAIAKFSLPAGLAAGIGILAAYLLARHAAGTTLEQARTVAAATVVSAGLAIVIALEDEPGRRRYAVIGLCALMAIAFVLVYVIPAGRHFFDLASPTAAMTASWAAGSADRNRAADRRASRARRA